MPRGAGGNDKWSGTLAPIRAQLERGITAAESAAADSKLAAAKRSAAEETSEVVIPDHL